MDTRPENSRPARSSRQHAERRLKRAAEQGIDVPTDTMGPILAARDALRSGKADRNARGAFYAAYAAMPKATERPHRNGEFHDPFEEAVEDAEHPLKYAAEMAVEVPSQVAAGTLAARTALDANAVTDQIRGDFYAAYTELATLFGDATMDTVRNCSSRKTRWALARTRAVAVVITLFIATVSVVTFVTDDMAKRISADIASANGLAAKLRDSLTANPEATINPRYATTDPCTLITSEPDQGERGVRDVQDVTQLQEFAATIRDLHSRAVKLNRSIWRVECDPCGFCRDQNAPPPDKNRADRELQLNPMIINHSVEVLCKIQSLQKVRSFANNVHGSYTAAFGAMAAYALPIYYSLLGAYAYRLRMFGEAVRRRTYHPSFADSARMITAVIAGAIVSLFYPAQGASLSPLAVAFLIGYGVEIFFKFLDGMINSLGSGAFPGQRPKPSSVT